MKPLLTYDLSTCAGCNRCIRVCPIEGANVAYSEGDKIKVRIDGDRCIACGACISACQHKARDYVDDTERFLRDLKNGVPISLFVAPANRAIGNNWGGLLTWLRRLGVKKIFDVSLGADICTWAHIRYIQKYSPRSLITQPCPAIVNYVLVHNHTLIPYLSPIQSPMICTAIYMRKHEGIEDRIAAISPCIAKGHEFEATNMVSYNVTLKKLYEYVKNNGIVLPSENTGFDHMESSLGKIYSMPGGLKENIESHLGKSLRIDKSEGPSVYAALDEFSQRDDRYLPAIFDVLNCQEGCNLGPGCAHEKSIFEINTIMDTARKSVPQTPGDSNDDGIYEYYDKTLHLEDFVRKYSPINVKKYIVNDMDIETAFHRLGKEAYTERTFDCSACGSDTCSDMARKIALGLNTEDNCIQKVRNDIHTEHNTVLSLQSRNLENIEKILDDVTSIKDLSDSINGSIYGINSAIEKFSKMAKEIDDIAMHINIISLNASVEAARAGQHGKTFAVVANEIRNLAGSSKRTVAESEETSKSASEAIRAVNGVVEMIGGAVAKAHDNISAIASNTREVLAGEK